MRLKRSTLILLLLALLSWTQLSAQNQPRRKPDRTWRIVGTIAGAIGGLAIAGAYLDDDRQSAGEYLTAIFLLPTAGGVGGYFLGRAIDRRTAFHPIPTSDSIQPEVERRLVEAESKKLQEMLQRQGLFSMEDVERSGLSSLSIPWKGPLRQGIEK